MSDTHYKFVETNGTTPFFYTSTETISPDKLNFYSETVKFSNVTDIMIENKIIIGSIEDCLDIVRMGNVVISNCAFIANNTRQGLTLKGGCKSLTIKNCMFSGDFGRADIVLGDHTIYKTAPTMRNVTIINCSASGRPLKVVALYAEKVTIPYADCKIDYYHYPKWLVKIVFVLINLKNSIAKKLK